MDTAAVILAGGLSSRMGGGDKPLLDLVGKPVLAHVIERLQTQVERIAINANGYPARMQQFGLPVIADLTPDFPGPLGGLQTGLAWAKAVGARRLITVAGDTPFFPTDMVARLSAAASNGTIVAAASAGRLHPTFTLWPIEIADDLDAFLKDGGRKVIAFIERHPHASVAFPSILTAGGDCDPFFNINTPGDLAEARRLLNG